MDFVSFQRLTRTMVQSMSDRLGFPPDHFKIGSDSIKAMQVYVESKVQVMYENANMAATHAKRVTVQSVDIELAAKLKSAQEKEYVRQYESVRGDLREHV
jgi:histone H3/H4